MSGLLKYNERWSKWRAVVNLFRFIDWVMGLPESLSRKIRQAVHEIETEKQVQYVTTIERFGRQEGLIEGRRQGTVDLLRLLLGQAFGELPESTLQRLDAANLEELERWSSRVLSARSLDEVFG